MLNHPSSDYILFCLIAGGVLCAATIRKLPSSPRRGWIKPASFLLTGTSAIGRGLADFKSIEHRSISPVNATGIIENLHTASGGYRSSPTLRFSLLYEDRRHSPDLHADDALLFMKADDGKKVQATFTSETGCVSRLRILDGPHAGYAFDEPDSRNTMPAILTIFVGLVLWSMGWFGWVVDRNADPLT